MQRLLVSRSLRRTRRRPARALQAPSPALLARKRSVSRRQPPRPPVRRAVASSLARRPHPPAACGHRRPRRDRHRRDRRHPGRRRPDRVGRTPTTCATSACASPATAPAATTSARIDGAFRTTVGTRLTLTDDDSVQLNVPFAFRFYGRSQTTAFVNSDGNLTFESGDRASTERNVARHADRSAARRAVPRRSRSVDRRPRLGERRRRPVHRDLVRRPRLRLDADDQRQLTLLPGGTIEMKFGAVSLADAIVGLVARPHRRTSVP